ncbi:hypothetical protein C0Z18_31635 [Trinickia dabaoshanensis]|uniref:Uncharacterized protein n=1 Tax=Trinickia dabaoshanensis TaxID=564714 RepID=A0A2N7VBC5_9BURK|nr:hypothetical protein [Trinickia dabaoshanensis]PMS14449.1 hypothetical protein C0Z18_31635 [Trinickia dabaoshanensis]
MGARKILTIGFELASDDSEYASFDSKLSLLDWDIILVKPKLGDFYAYSDDYYQGKRSLSDSSSFRLKESSEHWRREIKQAVDAGKTVIVYLAPLQEVYIDTGQRSYSGTGRNRQTTRHVALFTNYQAIPAAFSPVATSGTSMKLVEKGAEVLASYWKEFEGQSAYEVLLEGENVPSCLMTRAGDKPVGALYRSKASSGALLLLPDIDFDDERFIEEDESNRVWTTAASQFAGRFVSAIVALDKALRSSSEITPEPLWAADSSYALGPESALKLQLLEAERKVEEAQQEKEAVADQLVAAGKYRALLYEKGKSLERVIIDALRLMGFEAASFKESDSEFDVVFESDEGRLIGEAEGKDNKAVNIDKLRQLSMNIHEDLQRDEVTSPAKPVLFGNGYRLLPIRDRPDPFTEKCQSAATISSTALVHTPDLFNVVQHLLGESNPEFARECRRALLFSTGRVSFPEAATSSRPSTGAQTNES